MTTEIVDGELRYTDDSGNWRITLRTIDNLQEFQLYPVGTGDLICGSGVTLELLAQLVLDAKADAISRGLNWSMTGEE